MKLSEVLRKADMPREMPPMPPMPKINRSQFQLVLDNLNAAHRNMENVANLYSSLMVHAEKGMEYIDNQRRMLTQVLEETGAVVEALPIEEAISAFIPKRGADGQDQKIQTRSQDPLSGSPERD